jgi:hypothetical protein
MELSIFFAGKRAGASRAQHPGESGPLVRSPDAVFARAKDAARSPPDLPPFDSKADAMRMRERSRCAMEKAARRVDGGRRCCSAEHGAAIGRGGPHFDGHWFPAIAGVLSRFLDSGKIGGSRRERRNEKSPRPRLP